MAERARRAVACKTEIMQFLTEVMRGEVSAETPKLSERTKAAELLGKSQHLFGDKARESPKPLEVRIWGEEDL